MTYRNDFDISGRVISIQEVREDEAIITLMIKSHTEVYPRIQCKKAIIPDHKERAFLNVKGFAESWYTETKDGKALVPRLRATSVNFAETALEEAFGIKGRFWEHKPAMLYLSGRIEEIIDDETHMRYVILTENPATGEKIPVKINWRKIERHPAFIIGDEICAVCKIATPRKTIGTEDRIFMNFDVFDMDYLY